MFKACARAISLAVLVAPLSLEAARPVFKCTVNGSVTYQNDPCPSGEPRKAPTVEQLNAERQKALRQAASAAAASPASAPVPPLDLNPGIPPGSSALSEKAQPRPARAAKCDGRIHCSQMTSCAEAKYFLAHCPGVQMDGDRNGIPCEKQWCNR